MPDRNLAQCAMPSAITALALAGAALACLALGLWGLHTAQEMWQ